MGWNEEKHFNFGRGIYRLTNPIDPKFPGGALFDALNMVYGQGSDNVQTMHGATRIGTTDMGGDVSGLFDYKNGTTLVAASEDGKIYQYTGSDWAAESGARASGNSTTAGKRWSATMFYGATTAADILVLANNDDADDPAKYNGTDVTALGGSPPGNGKYPTVWQAKTWLFDTSIGYYSVTDNCEDWTGGGAGNIAIARGNDGDITGAAAFANNLFIFKRSSIYRISPTASFSSEAVVRNVSNNVGCISHQTIAEDERGLIFQSEHGYERITSSAAGAGFSINNISRWVKPLVDGKNTTHLDKGWGLYNLDRSEYLGYFATGNSTVPERGLICNLADGRNERWTRMDRTGLTAGAIFVENNTDYIQYVGDKNGRVYKMHDSTVSTFGGGSMTSRITTKYFTQGAPNHMKRYGWAYLNVEVDGSYLVTAKLNLLRDGLPSGGDNTAILPNLDGDQGWGVGEWGVALWGGSGTASTRTRPPSSSRGTGMRVTLESTRWFRPSGIVIASDMKGDRIAA